MRKWQEERSKKPLRHTNIHISRQSLRQSLLEQLHAENMPLWDHELIDIKEDEAQKMVLHFKVQGKLKNTTQTSWWVQTELGVLLGIGVLESKYRL